MRGWRLRGCSCESWQTPWQLAGPAATEVRIAEARAVLEPVAEQAVEADVRAPDAGEAQQRVSVEGSRERGERGRTEVAVSCVVTSRPRTPAREVTEHRQIGHQKQSCKGQP